MYLLRISIIIILSMHMISCAAFIDICLDSGKTNAQIYDEIKCEHGPVSSPGIPKRTGCVNADSEFENKNEYSRYQIAFEKYKDQIKNEAN